MRTQKELKINGQTKDQETGSETTLVGIQQILTVFIISSFKIHTSNIKLITESERKNINK